MSFVFSPQKATQAAASLIKRVPNRRINYTALIKLLYLADRQGFIEIGFPITGGRHVAMQHGPVLSNVLDLIGGKILGTDGQRYWSAHIRREGYEVVLVEDPGDSELSHFDSTVLEQIFAEHGNKAWSQLRIESHDLEEWEKTYQPNTSTEITLETILQAIGKSDRYDEIEQARIDELRFAALFGTEPSS